MSQENVEIMRRAWEAWESGDWEPLYGETVFRGIRTPGGKRFSTEHVHIYRVIDGPLAEHWVVRDDLGMMLQIGAITAGT